MRRTFDMMHIPVILQGFVRELTSLNIQVYYPYLMGLKGAEDSSAGLLAEANGERKADLFQ